MIHSLAVLQKITMATYTLKTKKLYFWFSLQFLLPLLQYITLLGGNKLGRINADKLYRQKKHQEKCCHFYLFTCDPPCCWHVQPANTTSTQLEKHSCLLFHLPANTLWQVVVLTGCASGVKLLTNSPSSSYLHTYSPSHQGSHINPNLPCNLCSSQPVLWGASIHYHCLCFIPFFIHFLNCCSSYLLSCPQSQETASHLSYSFTPSQIGLWLNDTTIRP